MRHSVRSFSAAIVVALATLALPLPAQTVPKRTAEQIKPSYAAHEGDFDYLLGDWQFTSVSLEFGKGRGYWSAVRLAEGAQGLDEYRLGGDSGQTYYASSPLRAS